MFTFQHKTPVHFLELSSSWWQLSSRSGQQCTGQRPHSPLHSFIEVSLALLFIFFHVAQHSQKPHMAYSGQRIAFEMKDPLILWEEERGGGGWREEEMGSEKVTERERERERAIVANP